MLQWPNQHSVTGNRVFQKLYGNQEAMASGTERDNQKWLCFCITMVTTTILEQHK